MVSKFENNKHRKWEFLKCRIRKFMAGYSKNKAKIRREKNSFLEKKNLEQNLNNEKMKSQHSNFKNERNIYEDTSNVIKIRSFLIVMNW